MSSREVVMYFQGLGKEPEIQQELPQAWAAPNREVILHRFNWRGTDYRQELEAVEDQIDQLAEPDVNIYLVGASAGSKPGLSLLIRRPEQITAAVMINGRISPYAADDHVDRRSHENLWISSDVLDEDTKQMDPRVPGKLLRMRSENDERIDPENTAIEAMFRESEEYIMDIDGHPEGIEYAITQDHQIIFNFFRSKCGILIPSEQDPQIHA